MPLLLVSCHTILSGLCAIGVELASGYKHWTCCGWTSALHMQASGNDRQKSLLKCLIHSMYDEIRFLHDYPDHELDRTARLLGAVIRNG